MRLDLKAVAAFRVSGCLRVWLEMQAFLTWVYSALFTARSSFWPAFGLGWVSSTVSLLLLQSGASSQVLSHASSVNVVLGVAAVSDRPIEMCDEWHSDAVCGARLYVGSCRGDITVRTSWQTHFLLLGI